MSLNSSKDSGDNNEIPPPEWSDVFQNVISMKDLSDLEKNQLLQRSGYLFGVCVDGVDGPRWLTRPVAKRTASGRPFIRDMNNVITEVIASKDERESNYVHQGWSLAAASAILPWTSARMANNQPNRNGSWVTRRTVVQRLSLRVSLQDLEPVADFETEMEAALEKSTTCDKFQAVYRALHDWGDVVPLETEVGISLSFTDSEENLAQLPIVGTYKSLDQLQSIRTSHIAKRGGDPNHAEWNDEKWFTMTVPPLEWTQVRVVAVAPTLHLLKDKLRKQLSDLYTQRLSYQPPVMIGPINHACKTHNDSQYISGTVASVTIRTSDYIEYLQVTYLDSRTSDKYGGGGHIGTEHKFTLLNDEHITDMITWDHGDWVVGLQFTTNFGRTSPFYGAGLGTPAVARSKGGVLTGFNSAIREHPQRGDVLSRIQGIWRHDLIGTVPKADDVFSEYFGYENGVPFNDRILVGNSNSMHISRVDIGCGEAIDSIQLTYTNHESGEAVGSKTVRHGGSGGDKQEFVLGTGEHIITVTGSYDKERITMLCFGTNLARTSLHGRKGGQAFSLIPRDKDRKCMRLHYICGKSDACLNGIMFVWTPL